jgi:hypothetical protein
MSERFRIPQRVVVAEVTLEGQPKTEYRFFLSEAAKAHPGPERPSDLLNGARSFLPAYDIAAECVAILRRDAIMLITMDAKEEFLDTDFAEIPEFGESTTGLIQVSLSGGQKISGELSYVMPDGQRRIQDFLNLGQVFVMLMTDGKVQFINKSHIVRINTINTD